jgi:uncharacterized protein
MKYSNDKVRRQDRLMDETDAIKLLTEGNFGILSMQDENGGGYGIPLNYVWDGQNAIYIHCAPEGKKLRCLEKNIFVTFCIIGKTHLVPQKFTTEYNSIILRGTAHIDLSNEEKMEALHKIVRKFSPNNIETGYDYSEKSFHRVNIIKINITEWSGKCKHLK